MKKVELSALLKQIQSELPGFKFESQLLFIDPINHTLHGVWLDHSIDPGSQRLDIRPNRGRFPRKRRLIRVL